MLKRSGLLWGAILFVASSLAWTWYAGKDLNWDFINYHFYGPYMLLNQRLGSDYFAGSLQTYLNPLGYVPLYWMIASGWHPLAIGATLALVHSVAFVLIWLITERVLPEHFPQKGLACLAACVLAFLSPLQLTTLGSTFLDPITALPVLAALYLLVRNAGAINLQHAGWIGLLMGLAAGLKLTNLLLLPACVVAIEAASVFSWSQAWRRAFAFSAASLAGVLVTHGYWSFELWREMGNPLFPLLNSIFQSPDFPLASFQDRRFLDRGLISILTLPFEMMGHAGWIYAENNAPDARPLALSAILLILLWTRLARGRSEEAGAANPRAFAFKGILAFALTFYLIWAATSRIGRYAFVLWLLVGPLAIAALARLPWRRIAPALLATTIAIQLLFQISTGNPRWNPMEWGTKWLDVRVPENLRDKPYSYLTMGVLSYSAVIPYFHKDSRFSNIVGQHMQPVGDRMTSKFRAFISPDTALKVVFVSKGLSERKVPESVTRDVDMILSSYGLGVADGPCEFVEISMDRLIGFESLRSLGKKPSPEILAVCNVVHRSSEATEAALTRMKEVDRAFDNAERSCQGLLNPPHVQTMRGGKGWMRSYFNSNTQLMSDGEYLFIRRQNIMNDLVLGSLEDWKKSVSSSKCADALSSM